MNGRSPQKSSERADVAVIKFRCLSGKLSQCTQRNPMPAVYSLKHDAWANRLELFR